MNVNVCNIKVGIDEWNVVYDSKSWVKLNMHYLDEMVYNRTSHNKQQKQTTKINYEWLWLRLWWNVVTINFHECVCMNAMSIVWIVFFEFLNFQTFLRRGLQNNENRKLWMEKCKRKNDLVVKIVTFYSKQ